DRAPEVQVAALGDLGEAIGAALLVGAAGADSDGDRRPGPATVGGHQQGADGAGRGSGDGDALGGGAEPDVSDGRAGAPGVDRAPAPTPVEGRHDVPSTPGGCDRGAGAGERRAALAGGGQSG